MFMKMLLIGTMDRGEYFKTSREAFSGCELKDVNEVRGGEEAAVLEGLKVQWVRLRERVAGEHGMGEGKFSCPVMSSQIDRNK